MHFWINRKNIFWKGLPFKWLHFDFASHGIKPWAWLFYQYYYWFVVWLSQKMIILILLFILMLFLWLCVNERVHTLHIHRHDWLIVRARACMHGCVSVYREMDWLWPIYQFGLPKFQCNTTFADRNLSHMIGFIYMVTIVSCVRIISFNIVRGMMTTMTTREFVPTEHIQWREFNSLMFYNLTMFWLLDLHSRTLHITRHQPHECFNIYLSNRGFFLFTWSFCRYCYFCNIRWNNGIYEFEPLCQLFTIDVTLVVSHVHYYLSAVKIQKFVMCGNQHILRI